MSNSGLGIKHFTIGHAAITVRSDSEALLGRIACWLADFETPASADAWAGKALTAARDAAAAALASAYVSSPAEAVDSRASSVTFFGYETGEPFPFRIPGEAQLTFENDTCRYYLHGGLWMADFPGMGLLLIDRAADTITGFAFSAVLMQSLAVFEDFMHPLFELLRQKGLYPHHTAAVSFQGNGLLLPGKSGRGKSTLSADLIHHGFHFLADDRCFVREQQDVFEVIGFYKPFKLYASNIAHLPVLERAEGFPVDEAKHNLDILAYYPERIERTAPLAGILFPHWSPNEKSRLEPLAPGKALLDLLPLTLVCFDSESSRAHFDFSAKMVRRLPAARLIMGGDRENWHRLAEDFILSPGRA